VSERCNYPICTCLALWVPVIRIPTVRRVGLREPELSPLVENAHAFNATELDRRMHIQQFEENTRYYKQHASDIVVSEKPTLLVGQPICDTHRQSYLLSDWITEIEWKHLREGAKAHGLNIDPTVMITVLFRPVGWKPRRYLEVER
jgi:hypothetical protein